MGVNVKFGWGSFVGLMASVLAPLAAFFATAADQGISDPKAIAYGAIGAAGAAFFQWFRSLQANAIVANGGTAVVLEAPVPDDELPPEGDPEG